MKKFYEDKTYILMCRKSEEIQSIWQSLNYKPSGGAKYRWNYHYEKGYKGSFYYNCDDEVVSCVDYEYGSDSLEKNEDIWLPRQDELQKMIGKGFEGLVLELSSDKKDYGWNNMKWGIGEIVGDEIDYNFKNCEMPEIALIQLLMRQQYWKIWNGNEWVKK